MPLNHSPPKTPIMTKQTIPTTANDAPVSSGETGRFITASQSAGLVSDSPLQQQHYDSEPDLRSALSHITERKKRKHDGGEDLNMMSQIKDMFCRFSQEQEKRFESLHTSVNTIKEQNDELTKSVDFMSKTYDEFVSRIQQLESERKDDKKYIQLLEDRVESLERRNRASGIEIRNVPKTTPERVPESKEEFCKLVKSMGTTLKIKIEDSDIKDVYRLSGKDFTKPVITEFASVIMKERVLSAVKQFNKGKSNENKINTTHLGLLNPSRPVYVSEALTSKSQKLYYLARNFQKVNEYSFCWTSRGIVYLRKEVQSPLIKIESEADLDHLRSIK
uniref:FP protein C-terminal domain-containing protein n=1 Tax=Pectinophora gossypiella TaxID=13191 RepID=A0A1E1W9J6_PECGO